MSTRRNATMKKRGGFNLSGEIWSFGICKSLIDMADLKAPAGTKKSHRKCLDFLAKSADMSTVDLFNKITPIEFIEKIGKRHLLNRYKSHYGKDKQLAKVPDLWHKVVSYRDAALKEGKEWGKCGDLGMAELPALPKSATRKSNNK